MLLKTIPCDEVSTLETTTVLLKRHSLLSKFNFQRGILTQNLVKNSFRKLEGCPPNLLFTDSKK